MNLIDYCTKGYSLLHKYPGVPFWVLTPIRKVVRRWANKILPSYLAKSCIAICKKKCEVTVSLTSFPARINNVWQVVECMMRQTYRPKKILLWLSKEQFQTEESIPKTLREREGDVFEIRMVEGNIRSHKKYIYAIQEFPDDYILLIDDDIYYPTDLIEKTWKAHLAFPNAVICNYGLRMLFSDGRLLRYRKWPRVYSKSENNIFFGSGGGTLIKSSMLYKDVKNIEEALKLTPIADDIWLNAMVNLAGTKKILLDNGQILPICMENDIKLAAQNRENDRNDKQLENVISYYTKKYGINPFINKN